MVNIYQNTSVIVSNVSDLYILTSKLSFILLYKSIVCEKYSDIMIFLYIVRP